jgi:error-prone DNA polymerase
VSIDLSRIPLDDPEVYSEIQRAETTGVFQIESRAQMQMLTRTLPESIEDLTVQVALVRPGPIQGGAVHPYLRHKEALRADPSYRVPYEHPSLEPILADTLGTIVFQEQVIQVAMALAGFSPGKAEGLRRAMSRKRSEAAILAYRDDFVEGAMARGASQAVAEKVFEQVRGFSGFGFPKAHAAAFGLLAYQSTWLRVHYMPELLCSLLNEQPMGFYPPDSLVHEAQRKGIEILRPDVNASQADCIVEPSLSVRIGLGYVNGLKEDDAQAIVAERERGGPYGDLADLAGRSGASRAALERLAWAGACDSIDDAADTSLARRPALWRLGIAAAAQRTPRGEQIALPFAAPSSPRLRELGDWELVVADYESTGMTIDIHPMRLIRPQLTGEPETSETLWRLATNTHVEAAGMVVARQRPSTANGIVFMLLEDEWGTINLIIPPPVYDRHRMAVRTAPFVHVTGKLERRDANMNILVDGMRRLERPDLPLAKIRPIEPPAERETERDAVEEAGAIADLAVALPAAHSFGRRR